MKTLTLLSLSALVIPVCVLNATEDGTSTSPYIVDSDFITANSTSLDDGLYLVSLDSSTTGTSCYYKIDSELNYASGSDYYIFAAGGSSSTGVLTLDGAGSSLSCFMMDIGGTSLGGTSGVGEVYLTNGASISAATTSGGIGVGASGIGKLSVSNSTISTYIMAIGSSLDTYSADYCGTVSIDGASSSVQVTSNIIVGYKASGKLDITGGASVSANLLYIGFEGGSDNSDVTIDASTLEIDGSLTSSGITVGSYGNNCSLTVENGAAVTCGSGLWVGAGGSSEKSSAASNCTMTVTGGSTVTLSNSTAGEEATASVNMVHFGWNNKLVVNGGSTARRKVIPPPTL